MRGSLTEKDVQGNWRLKGIKWEELNIGKEITREVWEKLYGALWKLMEYECTGLTPEEVLEGKLLTGWIPVEERLPEAGVYVLASVKRHHWIADYSEPVPESKKTDHPEAVYVTLARYEKMAGWQFLDLESDEDVPFVCHADKCDVEDLSYPLAEVVAWMALPEPYRE